MNHGKSSASITSHHIRVNLCTADWQADVWQTKHFTPYQHWTAILHVVRLRSWTWLPALEAHCQPTCVSSTKKMWWVRWNDGYSSKPWCAFVQVIDRTLHTCMSMMSAMHEKAAFVSPTTNSDSSKYSYKHSAVRAYRGWHSSIRCMMCAMNGRENPDALLSFVQVSDRMSGYSCPIHLHAAWWLRWIG